MAFSSRLSLSRVCHSRSPSGDVYTLCTLAENLRRGRMVYYRVQVHTTPVPSLSVGLVGVDGAHAGWRISASDLGPSGRRGAWASTPNLSGERHVVAFTTYPRASDGDDGTLNVPPETDVEPRMGEQVIAVVSSRYSGGE